jgi:hypothetical protein
MHRRLLRAGFTVKIEIMQDKGVIRRFPHNVNLKNKKTSTRQFHLLTYR